MSIHHNIVHAVQAANKTSPKPAASGIENMSDDELILLMFRCIKKSDRNEYQGLQLTEGGWALMSSYFKTYEVKFPNDHLVTPNILLYMSRHVESPWFFRTQDFVTGYFFDGEITMKAKLAGDLSNLTNIF